MLSPFPPSGHSPSSTPTNMSPKTSSASLMQTLQQRGGGGRRRSSFSGMNASAAAAATTADAMRERHGQMDEAELRRLVETELVKMQSQLNTIENNDHLISQLHQRMTSNNRKFEATCEENEVTRRSLVAEIEAVEKKIAEVEANIGHREQLYRKTQTEFVQRKLQAAACMLDTTHTEVVPADLPPEVIGATPNRRLRRLRSTNGDDPANKNIPVANRGDSLEFSAIPDGSASLTGPLTRKNTSNDPNGFVVEKNKASEAEVNQELHLSVNNYSLVGDPSGGNEIASESTTKKKRKLKKKKPVTNDSISSHRSEANKDEASSSRQQSVSPSLLPTSGGRGKPQKQRDPSTPTTTKQPSPSPSSGEFTAVTSSVSGGSPSLAGSGGGCGAHADQQQPRPSVIMPVMESGAKPLAEDHHEASSLSATKEDVTEKGGDEEEGPNVVTIGGMTFVLGKNREENGERGREQNVGNAAMQPEEERHGVLTLQEQRKEAMKAKYASAAAKSITKNFK